MKTAILLISILFTTGSFKPERIPYAADKPMYYVCYATEQYNKGKSYPVVSNVTYVNCNYHTRVTVEVQLFEYYNAFYSKSRNGGVLNGIMVFRYDTWDKAEKKRRELLAKFNTLGEVLHIEKFSVLCND